MEVSDQTKKALADEVEKLRAELNQNRLAYLAEISVLLSESLDVEALFQTVAQLAISKIAEWASVYTLVEAENGEYEDELKLVAIAHSDPAKLELAKAVRARYPLRLSDPGGVPVVVRTGQSIMADITDEMIEAGALDPDHLKMLRELGLTSTIVAPMIARGRTLGVIVYIAARPDRHFDSSDLLLAEELARRAALAVDNARLYQAEQQARQRLAFLAEATEILSSSLDYDELMAELVRLTLPELADYCLIDTFTEEKEVFQRSISMIGNVDPAKEELMRQIQVLYPPDPTSQVGISWVFHTGLTSFVPKIIPEMLPQFARNEEHLKLLQALGPVSGISVPLKAGPNKVVGVMSIAFSESGRHYTRADLSVAEELARRAGIALDKAQIYQAELRARRAAEQAADRLARLQVVTTALSATLHSNEAAKVIADQAVAALNAKSGIVALHPEYNQDGPLEMVYSTGYTQGVLKKWRKDLLAEGLPFYEAMRTGQPLLIESLKAGIDRFPKLADLQAQLGSRAWAFLPFSLDGRTVGGIGLSFGESQHFDDADRDFLVALAEQCTQALNRVRLYEAEQRSRTEAEQAQQRLTFLAEASSVLVASLDYEVTLQNVAQMVVPYLADWCTVHILDENNYPQEVALVHSDPAKVIWARELGKQLAERYPYNPDAPTGLPNVLRTGQPELYSEIPDEMLVAVASGEELLQLLRDIGYSSVMIVPLVARGRVLGAIQFVTTESGYHYTQQDLGLAGELARRAAIAVDNARLYQDTQKALAAQQELDRLRDRFVSVASHELRTPLTSIKGFAQMLQNILAKRLEAASQPVTMPLPPADFAATSSEGKRESRLLKNIEHQVDRMTELIGEMLDISRIQSGQLALTLSSGLNIVELVRKTIEQQQAVSPYHPITLVTEFPQPQPWMSQGCWDERRMEQVISNLLNNAVKYSPRGKPVKVGIEYQVIKVKDDSPGPEPAVTVWVCDEGYGIAPQDQANVFQRYYRATNEEGRNVDGLGLGLFISKEIVEHHCGRIWVESQLGQGSTFYLRIPLQCPAIPEEPA